MPSRGSEIEEKFGLSFRLRFNLLVLSLMREGELHIQDSKDLKLWPDAVAPRVHCGSIKKVERRPGI